MDPNKTKAKDSKNNPLISYQPFGVKKRGRGVAYEWPLKTVLKFVEAGIALKKTKKTLQQYIVGYDRISTRDLERIRRWLLKAQKSTLPIIEVPSTGSLIERFDYGHYYTVPKWFGCFIHDYQHKSMYCPKCKASFPRGKEKFLLLRDKIEIGWTSHRDPTGISCPKGHFLMRR